MAQPVDALWTRVICKQHGRYIGWPTIARCKTGELLAVFSGDRDEHVCPWGKMHEFLRGALSPESFISLLFDVKTDD